jgi:hypothetical protein
VCGEWRLLFGYRIAAKVEGGKLPFSFGVHFGEPRFSRGILRFSSFSTTSRYVFYEVFFLTENAVLAVFAGNIAFFGNLFFPRAAGIRPKWSAVCGRSWHGIDSPIYACVQARTLRIFGFRRR